MKARLLPVTCAALFAAGCAGVGDPWQAAQSHAADATIGERSLVRTHYAIDEECQPLPLPAIALSEQAPRGTLSAEETTAVVNAPGTECDGAAVPAVGIFYQPAGPAGIDEISYVELAGPPQPDIVHTLVVRVR